MSRPLLTRAEICPTNHWLSNDFAKMVDQNEEQEVRVAAAYERPIERDTIRASVVGAILAYAMPAGNA